MDKSKSFIIYVTDRKCHNQRYAINQSKAMAELGFQPTIMFKNGVKV